MCLQHCLTPNVTSFKNCYSDLYYKNDLFKVKIMTSDFDLHRKYWGHDLFTSLLFDNGLLLLEDIHKVWRGHLVLL